MTRFLDPYAVLFAVFLAAAFLPGCESVRPAFECFADAGAWIDARLGLRRSVVPAEGVNGVRMWGVSRVR